MSTNGMAAVIFQGRADSGAGMKADSRDGQPLAPAGAHDARPVALSCRGIWKIFGPRAAEFLASRSGRVAPADLLAANLIGAVRDASLSVKRGEIFIIMGLSGSGKSTLLRCLSRLIEPTAGAVEFEGRDLLKLSEAELIEIRRHKMGMVFQHFALLPHLTVLENVAFPLAVQGIGRKSREDRAREVIELVGLEGREHHYPRELSGGQQQRVGIARSLAVKPDIWFLDEPFSALDPLIRREMQEELMRLQSVLRKTIIFITHDFDEAIRLADRIAIMKDGEIIQSGTPEELVLHPATDYVAEFTRDVQRAKVMSAARLMQPLSGKTEGEAPRIHADTKIAAFAADIVAARKCFIVLGADNLPIGEITPEAVIGLLAGSEHAGAPR
jgi:glycine betaine/proline transport system ATP-binding protein